MHFIAPTLSLGQQGRDLLLQQGLDEPLDWLPDQGFQALPDRVSGSNATKTYGKGHSQRETFPITRLFGKVCARRNQQVKDL